MTDTRVTVSVKIGGETVEVSRLASPVDGLTFEAPTPATVRLIAVQAFESAASALGYSSADIATVHADGSSRS